MATMPQLFERETHPPDSASLGPSRRQPSLSSPLRDSSDRRLARRASQGDRRAIATIFERYQQELYRFCLGLLGEPQDAQDALQNTMVKVMRALPGEEREIALRPWLYRIAHNEAIELRRTRHPTQVLEGHLVDGQSSVTERAEQREQLEWLLKDLGDLPERQRTVLVMRELSGLDFAEIGAALDTSGAVVRQSLYEARRNLEQMDHGRGMKCEAVTRVLSDADRRITRRRDIRAHLRECPDCQRFQEAIGKRKDILAAIPPLPTAAAAGIAGLLGGSGGGGTVAVLTGGVAKSAGVYGALKAVGTVAVVAAVGTAAIQSEIGRTPPDSASHAQVRSDSSPSPSPSPLPSPRRGTVPAAHPGGPPHRPVLRADGSSSAAAKARISDRRAHPSPVRRELAAEIISRPGSSSHQAKSPAGNLGTESAQGEGVGRPSKPQKQEKQPAPAPGQAKKGAEAEKAPPGQDKKRTEVEKVPPGQAKKWTDVEKVPPGQAKKQAEAAVPTPSTAPPPVVETEPAADGAEATEPAEGPSPNGKAKGHEKQLETAAGQD